MPTPTAHSTCGMSPGESGPCVTCPKSTKAASAQRRRQRVAGLEAAVDQAVAADRHASPATLGAPGGGGTSNSGDRRRSAKPRIEIEPPA